jgi:hypothetical protein
VTTTSPLALETYDAGVEAALGWKANALDRFREATRPDPSLPFIVDCSPIDLVPRIPPSNIS